MSSRQETKRRARQEREAAEHEAAAATRRKRRLLQLGAVLAVAAVVVVALIVITSSGKDSGTDAGSTDTSGVTGAAEANALFAGIPQKGTSLGDPKAPLVLTEFADPQCPFCRDYALGVLPTIVKRYVRAGKLRLELRPIAIVGPNSADGVRAAASASQQNRMYQFTDLQYRNQEQENSGWITPESMRDLAAAVPGLSPARVATATSSAALDPVRAPWSAEAQRLAVDSTPSFFIRGAGLPQRRLDVSELTPAAFTKQIDPLLRGK